MTALRLVIFSLCLAVFTRVSAQPFPPMPADRSAVRARRAPLLSPRQADQVTRRMSLVVVATNRVPFVTTSRLIGSTNYVWTNYLYLTNVSKIVTMPGSALMAPPSNTTVKISWVETVSLLAGDLPNSITNSISIKATRSVSFPIGSVNHFFRVPIQSQTASVTWDASPDPQVSGYKVSFGPATGTYDQFYDVGLATEFQASTLVPGQVYFFIVSAYDAVGSESASEEVPYKVPLPDVAESIRLL